MTRTEDRLTDALTAAARAVPEDTLRPLVAPPARRRRPAWITPLAAALGIVLVIGLALAAGTRLSGSRSPGGPAGAQAPVPRYYVVEGDQGGSPVVRSTGTGKVTATVPVPKAANVGVFDVLASTRGGVFFVAAAAPGTEGQRLYRFRLTSSGQVSGFTPVPGGAIGRHYWAADALAVSPDGSRVAVSVGYTWTGSSTTCGGAGQQACPLDTPQPDYIEVIDLKTGARSVWRGGNGAAYSVASLSWTTRGQLVYLGQTCGDQKLSSETCTNHGRTAVVRALNSAAGGGRLGSGPVLLRQSARFPYIAQALISPDGRTITAVVLTGRMTTSGNETDLIPPNLSVIQLSRATGQLHVLYQRYLGNIFGSTSAPDVLQLSQDAAGQHWMLNGGVCRNRCPAGGFNGWLRGGQLVPLPPVNGQEGDQAW
jgi:hypothetical protein